MSRPEIINPPEGFSVTIGRSGLGRSLESKDLYSATLHALLHFSLHSYEGHAEIYTTRGPEPPGVVVTSAIPFHTPPAYIPRNCHMAWGLYRSVIAFNYPVNVRESVATIHLDGRRIALVEYLLAPRAQVSAKGGPGNTTTSLSYVSALQMLQANDNGTLTPASLKLDALGYSLRWVFSPVGDPLRRETVYDTVAYAILWTGQFNEDTRFTGIRTISVPGGRTYLRLESYQVAHWDPMTYGFAATVTRSIPQFLETNSRFQEAFAQVLTPDNKICGTVGIFISGDINHLETIEAPDNGGVQTA
ncbi:MAG: hypothetical protein Q9166_005796 [cf. Caloplaca sp. 2 TL-2023]